MSKMDLQEFTHRIFSVGTPSGFNQLALEAFGFQREHCAVYRDYLKLTGKEDFIPSTVEQIPFLYPGGIDGFYENEVKPYEPEVVFGEPTIGYELSFTKYFYKPVKLRSIEDIKADIRDIEASTEGLLNDILGR